MSFGVRKEISLMPGYHSVQVEVDVRLNTNESPLAPSKAWMDALMQEVGDLSLNRYPDRQAMRLREALARRHGVEVEEVFCANGSNEVLQSLLLAYAGPGRTALVFEPTYALHSHIARITASNVEVVQREEDFSIATEKLERAIASSEPAVVFLCSPNNPTGASEDSQIVARALEMTQGLVVVDEAYGPFSEKSCQAMRTGPGGERLVIVTSFSKTWALAGVRLGYAIASASVVSAMESVVLPYHLDSFTQVAGRLALEHESETQQRILDIRSGRLQIQQGLGRLAVKQWPSDANFVLFRPNDLPGKQVWQRLVERSVLVRDCSSWPGLQDCLRVTVGTQAENVAFLNALEESLSMKESLA